MSGSEEGPWSNNPNAPLIPYPLYLGEKETFAGLLLGTILYGAVIVLFFRCITALLNPINHEKGGIKWGLVAHTLAMFSAVTINIGMNLDVQSLSYIDKREFPGAGVLFPGPLGYEFLINSNVLTVLPDVMFTLNGWLADGLLLYRCYVIYAMNYWVVAFPALMYLATLAMGIALLYYQASKPYSAIWDSANPDFGAPYYSISFSLNALLTLMIVIRLILHSRNVRNAMGTEAGAVGMHKAIITMLVESAALYAVAFLLYIGSWGAQSPAQFIFLPVLTEAQVIAPFLIILRVADRRALTSETIVSGNLGSIRFQSQGRESTVDIGPLPDEDPVGPASADGEGSGELGVDVANTIEEVQS